MTELTIEQRLSALERELVEIRRQIAPAPANGWFQRVAGSLRDEPDFDEVLQLGRELRQSEILPGDR